MTCQQTFLKIKIGNDNEFEIALSSQTLGFVFTVSGVTTYPSAGDIYFLNGHTFRVVSAGAGVIRVFSDVLIDYEYEVASTGTLQKVSGAGDATIAYTARTTNIITRNGKEYAPIDATGHTITDIKFKELPTSTTALLTLPDVNTWVSAQQGIANILVTASQTLALANYSFCFFTFSITGLVYHPQEIWSMISVQTSKNF